VLDSNFRGFFWTRAQAMLPAWFKEAVVDVPKNGMLPQQLEKIVIGRNRGGS
jgi:hypothetical protein